MKEGEEYDVMRDITGGRGYLKLDGFGKFEKMIFKFEGRVGDN